MNTFIKNKLTQISIRKIRLPMLIYIGQECPDISEVTDHTHRADTIKTFFKRARLNGIDCLFLHISQSKEQIKYEEIKHQIKKHGIKITSIHINICASFIAQFNTEIIKKSLINISKIAKTSLIKLTVTSCDDMIGYEQYMFFERDRLELSGNIHQIISQLTLLIHTARLNSICRLGDMECHQDKIALYLFPSQLESLTKSFTSVFKVLNEKSHYRLDFSINRLNLKLSPQHKQTIVRYYPAFLGILLLLLAGLTYLGIMAKQLRSNLNFRSSTTPKSHIEPVAITEATRLTYSPLIYAHSLSEKLAHLNKIITVDNIKRYCHRTNFKYLDLKTLVDKLNRFSTCHYVYSVKNIDDALSSLAALIPCHAKLNYFKCSIIHSKHYIAFHLIRYIQNSLNNLYQSEKLDRTRLITIISKLRTLRIHSNLSDLLTMLTIQSQLKHDHILKLVIQSLSSNTRKLFFETSHQRISYAHGPPTHININVLMDGDIKIHMIQFDGTEFNSVFEKPHALSKFIDDSHHELNQKQSLMLYCIKHHCFSYALKPQHLVDSIQQLNKLKKNFTITLKGGANGLTH